MSEAVISEAMSMPGLYPQKVEHGNPTIGGLSKSSQFVNKARMSDSEPQYLQIGQRLAAVRQAFSGQSQQGWAKMHGFNPTQWNNWEKGVRRIPVECAERLADAYGLDLDFIYRGRRDGLSESARNLL